MSLIFDIETGPLTPDTVREVIDPFDPASVKPPGPFDPESVKYGNTKDSAKRAAILAKAKAAHQKKLDDFPAELVNAERAYYAKAMDNASLSAATGSVVAIGYCNEAGKDAIHTEIQMPEDEMLRQFWSKYEECRQGGRKLIGFYSNRFDVPFLVRRSWVTRVRVPESVFTPGGYLCPVFVDLLERWQCGDRQASISLDRACKAMGVGCKPNDCTGSKFHQLLHLEGGYEAAIRYLRNDLAMTLGLAKATGIV